MTLYASIDIDLEEKNRTELLLVFFLHYSGLEFYIAIFFSSYYLKLWFSCIEVFFVLYFPLVL